MGVFNVMLRQAFEKVAEPLHIAGQAFYKAVKPAVETGIDLTKQATGQVISLVGASMTTAPPVPSP